MSHHIWSCMKCSQTTTRNALFTYTCTSWAGSFSNTCFDIYPFFTGYCWMCSRALIRMKQPEYVPNNPKHTCRGRKSKVWFLKANKATFKYLQASNFASKSQLNQICIKIMPGKVRKYGNQLCILCDSLQSIWAFCHLYYMICMEQRKCRRKALCET